MAATVALGAHTVPPANLGVAPALPQAPTAPASPVAPRHVDLAAPDAVTFATFGGFAAPVTFAPPAVESAAAPSSTFHVGAVVKGALAALLISVSLWALLAAALPGVGGLARSASSAPVHWCRCMHVRPAAPGRTFAWSTGPLSFPGLPGCR